MSISPVSLQAILSYYDADAHAVPLALCAASPVARWCCECSDCGYYLPGLHACVRAPVYTAHHHVMATATDVDACCCPAAHRIVCKHNSSSCASLARERRCVDEALRDIPCAVPPPAAWLSYKQSVLRIVTLLPCSRSAVDDSGVLWSLRHAFWWLSRAHARIGHYLRATATVNAAPSMAWLMLSGVPCFTNKSSAATVRTATTTAQEQQRNDGMQMTLQLAQLCDNVTADAHARWLCSVVCVQLTSLRVTPTLLLPVLTQRCTELVSLSLRGHADVGGLSALAQLRHLRSLDVATTRVRTLDGWLSALAPTLQVLDVSACVELRDLRAVGTLLVLRELRAMRLPQLRSLAALATCRLLEQIHVAHCDALTSLDETLLSLSHLRVLDVSYTSIANVPHAVRRCAVLVRLYATACPFADHEDDDDDNDNDDHSQAHPRPQTQPRGLLDAHRRLAGLTNLHQLQYLCLRRCALRCLRPLAACTALREVDLSECDELIDDDDDDDWGACLAQLPHLRVLRLNYVTQLYTVDWLAACTRLEEVYLRGCVNVVDAYALQHLTRLRVCDVAGSGLDDVTWVTRLRACLRELDLIDCEYVTDLQPLSQLQQLRRLCLGDYNGCDVSWLAGCVALEQLYVINARRLRDVRALARLTRLRVLHVKHSDVGDVRALAACTALRHLDLSYSPRLRDVSVVGCMPWLRVLSVHHSGLRTLGARATVATATGTGVAFLRRWWAWSKYVRVGSGRTTAMHRPVAMAAAAAAAAATIWQRLARCMVDNRTRRARAWVSRVRQRVLRGVLHYVHHWLARRGGWRHGTRTARLTHSQQRRGQHEDVVPCCHDNDDNDNNDHTRGVAQCSCLQVVDVSWCRHLCDLSALAQLPRLQTVDMSGTAVVDATWVAQCGALRTVRFDACTRLRDTTLLERVAMRT